MYYYDKLNHDKKIIQSFIDLRKVSGLVDYQRINRKLYIYGIHGWTMDWL